MLYRMYITLDVTNDECPEGNEEEFDIEFEAEDDIGNNADVANDASVCELRPQRKRRAGCLHRLPRGCFNLCRGNDTDARVTTHGALQGRHRPGEGVGDPASRERHVPARRGGRRCARPSLR